MHEPRKHSDDEKQFFLVLLNKGYIMSRTPSISWTTIDKILSAKRRKAREKERDRLIEAQSGGAKELPTQYNLVSVDFNKETRACKIVFHQYQKYRTVERYVTRNYVRYPIYSDWKSKSKTIVKSIKLTNQELERLNYHKDFLISSFSSEIVEEIGMEELLPSWFIRDVIHRLHEENIAKIESDLKIFKKEIKEKIEVLTAQIAAAQTGINGENIQLVKYQKRKSSIDKKIEKVEGFKRSQKVFFNILTLSYYLSGMRHKKLHEKEQQYHDRITSIRRTIENFQSDIEKHKNEIQELERQKQARSDEAQAQIQEEYKIKLKEMKSVVPLDVSVNCDSRDEFVPLKNIIGYEYKKIIGCYVIRNVKNSKTYVGQSKDVMKRIKQHFKGTVPNNIIFAEDYYATPAEERADLFEITIIPCETKDELDKTERELIEQHEAFAKGYNGTNGNN